MPNAHLMNRHIRPQESCRRDCWSFTAHGHECASKIFTVPYMQESKKITQVTKFVDWSKRGKFLATYKSSWVRHVGFGCAFLSPLLLPPASVVCCSGESNYHTPMFLTSSHPDPSSFLLPLSLLLVSLLLQMIGRVLYLLLPVLHSPLAIKNQDSSPP